MTHLFLTIERRARNINSTPFHRESLRFSVILQKLSESAKEVSVMGGGSGLEDLLLDIAAHCVAWVDVRRKGSWRDDRGLEHKVGEA